MANASQMTTAATSAPDGSSRPINLFDLLRVLGALMVMWGHAHSLTGFPPPGWFGNAIGTLGVKLFFVISGLLITRSWMADPRPWAFAQRRILRIMPGLILVTVVAAFLLGPLVTTLSLHEYLTSSGARLYLRNTLLFPVYSLPGVFADNPYPSAVNGSLWSLPAEVLMYILTPLLVGRPGPASRWGILVGAVLSAVVGIYFNRIAPLNPQPVVYGSSIPQVLEMMAYFQIGSVCAVFNLERFARPGLSLALLVTCATGLKAVENLSNTSVLSEVVLLLTLPFAVISVGEVTLSGLAACVLSMGDISYGLYLYSFPVEQLVSHLFHGIGPRHNFAYALPITVICAIMSWKLAEQPSLKLKPRRARRPENPAGAASTPSRPPAGDEAIPFAAPGQ